MTRHGLDHPTREGVHAIYGFDPALGFFVDVFREGRERPITSYDFFQPTFNRERPLIGCLDFLVSEGFFAAEDLEDALIAIQDNTRVPKRLTRVVEVIMGFRGAAD